MCGGWVKNRSHTETDKDGYHEETSAKTRHPGDLPARAYEAQPLFQLAPPVLRTTPTTVCVVHVKLQASIMRRLRRICARSLLLAGVASVYHNCGEINSNVILF